MAVFDKTEPLQLLLEPPSEAVEEEAMLLSSRTVTTSFPATLSHTTPSLLLTRHSWNSISPQMVQWKLTSNFEGLLSKVFRRGSSFFSRASNSFKACIQAGLGPRPAGTPPNTHSEPTKYPQESFVLLSTRQYMLVGLKKVRDTGRSERTSIRRAVPSPVSTPPSHDNWKSVRSCFWDSNMWIWSVRSVLENQNCACQCECPTKLWESKSYSEMNPYNIDWVKLEIILISGDTHQKTLGIFEIHQVGKEISLSSTCHFHWFAFRNPKLIIY